jgi:hypothetical protein
MPAGGGRAAIRQCPRRIASPVVESEKSRMEEHFTSALASTDEVLGYIERHKLHGKGIGYVDVHLPAFAAPGGTKLWTCDRRLLAVAWHSL